jgi:hypothetical protein
MMTQRYWMAGAAVVAAVVAVPLTQAGQAAAQQAKAQATVSQPASQPQVLSRDGRPVRVVYGAPLTAK